MSDDNAFLSADEAFEAFKPQFDKLVEDKISQKSGRLEALTMLDRMDETAQTLGLPQVDKVKVATYMKENNLFDPDQAVRAVYSGSSENSEGSTIAPHVTQQVREPITRSNLQQKIHDSFGEEQEDFSPEALFAGLRAQLGVK